MFDAYISGNRIKKEPSNFFKLVFSCTGSKGIDETSINKYRDDVYISCATSSDDELSEKILKNKISTSNGYSKYEFNRKCFNLINDGVPSNFLDKRDSENRICLVQGEIIEAIKYLYSNRLDKGKIIRIKRNNHLLSLYANIFLN